MAIIAYTGVMGSGKTYEAVKSAAMAALKAGRRVVTNISGFNYEAIRDYLGPLDGDLLQPEKVLVVPSSRVTEPHFFYDPDVEADSVVKPGDLALLDEVWAFWGREVKLSPEHQKFFRMHRHYTELGTGMSCDLVLMIQDLTSLHRFIAGVLESSFKFTKMKSLGLTSRYRVEVYEGNKQRKATLVSASVNKYDKRIFPLYTSYDGGHGKERTVDDRQNLLRNPWFLSVAIVSTLALIAGAWWFVGWVQKMRTGGGAKNTVPATQVGSPVGAAATSGGNGISSVVNSATGLPDLSKEIRLVAVLAPTTGETLVVFQTPDGRYVRQRMNAGLIDGWQSVAGYQGRMVGFAFGGKAK